MSIPDTHTILFTQIPEIVERKWSLRDVDVQSNSVATEQANKHADALIVGVQLTVEFNQSINDDPQIVDESFDREEDRIQVWQESRKSYAAIESAIADVIKELVIKTANDARDSGMRTASVLTRTNTTVRRRERRQSREWSNANLTSNDRVSTILSSRTNTIRPDESASMLPIRQKNSAASDKRKRSNNKGNSSRVRRFF
jgi:hypothetical protein